MPAYTFIRKIIRVQGKIRAFLVLKYNQKHIEFIETTLMKYTQIQLNRPSWRLRGRSGRPGTEPRAPGRPARPAAPRYSHLPG